jgi:hypothetical protein
MDFSLASLNPFTIHPSNYLLQLRSIGWKVEQEANKQEQWELLSYYSLTIRSKALEICMCALIRRTMCDVIEGHEVTSVHH